MYITRIEDFGKSKIKIYVDEEYRFWLYNRDKKKYELEAGQGLSREEYEEIYKLNLNRAKKQVLNLLQRMDKTRQEVIRKLQQAGYCDSIITETLAYIDTYHYIDDERYARSYTRYKRDSKSKLEIQNQLMNKGVSKDLIEKAISEEYGTEDQAIIKAINKKKGSKKELSPDDIRKITTNLYNKGYNIDLIRKYLMIE